MLVGNLGYLSEVSKEMLLQQQQQDLRAADPTPTQSLSLEEGHEMHACMHGDANATTTMHVPCG
jgi:hypothetical protein